MWRRGEWHSRNGRRLVYLHAKSVTLVRRDKGRYARSLTGLRSSRGRIDALLLRCHTVTPSPACFAALVDVRKPLDGAEFQAAPDRTISRLTLARQKVALRRHLGTENEDMVLKNL